MNRKMLLPALLLIVVVLAGCSPQEQPEVDIPTLGSVSAQPAPMQVNPSAEPAPQGTGLPVDITLPEGIDPTAEEDSGDDVELIGVAAEAQAQANQSAQSSLGGNSTPSPFAGSSPIPLNPIDMPTPTPRPALSFTYETYTASRLGLTFESVAGYEVDESSGDAIVLREPASMWKDNKGVVITLSQATVSAGYTKDNVRRDLITKLSDLGQVNYSEWRPSNTAERSLMGSAGYYANYRGQLMDGTIVRGRVHMALLPGNRVLTLHIEHPAEYNEDYIGVHSHIRSTLKAI